MTIGFLGYSAFPPEGYFYFEDRPGIAHVDSERLGNEICNARKHCDFLIVSFHWGKEFEFFASESQKKLARLAIDNGADTVVGHHPHVLQGVEMYKGKFIAYCLGNFIFDRQIPEGTDETVIVNLLLSKEGIRQIVLVPVRIADSRPEPARAEDAQYILDRLRLYSEGMNGRMEVKGGRGYLR
jgi:gamma-polyglutamate biosynthesis protein CapA